MLLDDAPKLIKVARVIVLGEFRTLRRSVCILPRHIVEIVAPESILLEHAGPPQCPETSIWKALVSASSNTRSRSQIHRRLDSGHSPPVYHDRGDIRFPAGQPHMTAACRPAGVNGNDIDRRNSANELSEQIDETLPEVWAEGIDETRRESSDKIGETRTQLSEKIDRTLAGS